MGRVRSKTWRETKRENKERLGGKRKRRVRLKRGNYTATRKYRRIFFKAFLLSWSSSWRKRRKRGREIEMGKEKEGDEGGRIKPDNGEGRKVGRKVEGERRRKKRNAVNRSKKMES